jgi:hypothetical protein
MTKVPSPQTAVESEPDSSKSGNLVEVRELTSEEEKTLLRWSRHINQFNQTFEQCMNCDKYTFIRVSDEGDKWNFKCPECGQVYMLKK